MPLFVGYAEQYGAAVLSVEQFAAYHQLRRWWCAKHWSVRSSLEMLLICWVLCRLVQFATVILNIL